MKEVTRQKLLGQVWDMFNAHGISVIPDEDKPAVMEVTISFKRNGKLSSNITFTRPAEVGILSWMPDKEWQELKEGNLPKEVSHD